MDENQAWCAACQEVEVDEGEGVCDPCLQRAHNEAVAELFASGQFRNDPCADCGTVTFFPDPQQEYCIPCNLRRTYGDRYCSHCGGVRAPADSLQRYGQWRDWPPCMACGAPGYFATANAPHCLTCWVLREFEDPICPTCHTIPMEFVEALLEEDHDAAV